MSKILLVGSSGFLGNYIFDFLLNGNHKVDTLNRTKGDYMIDLSNPFNLGVKYDIVIHCAGLAHVSDDLNLSLFHQINVIGTQNLLNSFSQNLLPSKLVFISSVAVYGRSNGNLISESAELGATDKYGESKINAEKIILDWGLKNNVKITILRLPLVVGKNPPGNLKAMISGIKKGYFFNINKGVASKSMVLALDVARYILIVAEIGGIYNLTDRLHPTFKQLSNKIQREYGGFAFFSIPSYFASVISFCLRLVGLNKILNKDKIRKMCNDLTFDDTKAVKMFNWEPASVIDSKWD